MLYHRRNAELCAKYPVPRNHARRKGRLWDIFFTFSRSRSRSKVKSEFLQATRFWSSIWQNWNYPAICANNENRFQNWRIGKVYQSKDNNHPARFPITKTLTFGQTEGAVSTSSPPGRSCLSARLCSLFCFSSF